MRIFEYQPSMVHAQPLVADGRWASVGTNNVDNRSMAFTDESVLMVYDCEVAEKLERLFHADLH